MNTQDQDHMTDLHIPKKDMDLTFTSLCHMILMRSGDMAETQSNRRTSTSACFQVYRSLTLITNGQL